MAIILENNDVLFKFNEFVLSNKLKDYAIEDSNHKYALAKDFYCSTWWYIVQIKLEPQMKRTFYGKKYLYHDCILLGEFNFNDEIFMANTNDKTYLNIIKNLIEKIPPIEHFNIYPKYNSLYWQSSNSDYINLLYDNEKGYYNYITKYHPMSDY